MSDDDQWELTKRLAEDESDRLRAALDAGEALKGPEGEK